MEAERRKEYHKARVEQRARENQIRIARGLDPLPENPGDDDSDDGAAKEDDDDFDVVLSEAGRILRDWITTQTPDKRLVDIEGITKSTPPDPRMVPATPSQAADTRIH